ncbi:hypothetical protein [Phenylobacterium immobile]|uniref:hypothetical protein n=1 Tax=Phenylobacterium immobile TaxID=21 RepID=UPI000A6A4556|nr:hypothetical protein [Phenylobacterium immobile]
MSLGRDREQRLRDEAQALWRALRDGEPPVDASADDLLSTLLSQIPAAPSYDRLRSPYLRHSQIARPVGD